MCGSCMVMDASWSLSWLYRGIVGVFLSSSLFSRKAKPSIAASVFTGSIFRSASASYSSVFICVGM